MLVGLDLADACGLTALDPGQAARILGVVVVAALGVELEPAREQDHLTAGGQFGGGFGVAQANLGLLDPRGRHLARQGAAPDQLIEAPLVGFHLHAVGAARGVGGADRLVRLLGVGGAGLVHARRGRQVFVAKASAHGVADRHHGLGRHVDAVGAHVGDQARLIEALGDLHGALGIEAQLARCLHLQGRGPEGRWGIAVLGAGLDRFHPIDAQAHQIARTVRLGLGGDGHRLDPPALECYQARGEFLAQMGLAGRLDRPVLARAKPLDLDLAVDHQAQGNRLHPARRPCTGQLAPQHRRQGKAEQIVQRATRQIGIDQGPVDVARIGHRGLHRVLGDGVECDPLHRLLSQRALVLLAQHLQHVPADGLTLAVGVGGQDQAVLGLQLVGDGTHLAPTALVECPRHGKVLVGQDRAVLFRQVADMAIAGQHPIALAQIFLDLLGLGGRFDDDEGHGGRSPGGWTAGRWGAGPAAVNAATFSLTRARVARAICRKPLLRLHSPPPIFLQCAVWSAGPQTGIPALPVWRPALRVHLAAGCGARRLR